MVRYRMMTARGFGCSIPIPNDAVDIGAIRGRVLPANSFALAAIPGPTPGTSVTGIFGAHVVAVDTDTGAVIAGTLGGWSCDASSPVVQFDGSFDIERLPVGHNYIIYVEPLVGLATPGDFSMALNDLCASSSATPCTTPAVEYEFQSSNSSGQSVARIFARPKNKNGSPGAEEPFLRLRGYESSTESASASARIRLY